MKSKYKCKNGLKLQAHVTRGRKTLKKDSNKLTKQKSKTDSLGFLCVHCKIKFPSKKDIYKHTYSTHTGLFKCNYWDTAFQSFKSIHLLRDHLISCHKNTQEAFAAQINKTYFEERWHFVHKKILKSWVKCNKCAEEFMTYRQLHAHTIFEHYNHRSCKLCQEVFEGSENLLFHLELVSHIKQPKECETCKLSFRDTFDFIWHFQKSELHNPGMEDLILICEICGKSFSFGYELRSHYRWQHTDGHITTSAAGDEETYLKKFSQSIISCTGCGSDFKSKFDIAAHLVLCGPSRICESDTNVDADLQINESNTSENMTVANLQTKDISDCVNNFQEDGNDPHFSQDINSTNNVKNLKESNTTFGVSNEIIDVKREFEEHGMQCQENSNSEQEIVTGNVFDSKYSVHDCTKNESSVDIDNRNSKLCDIENISTDVCDNDTAFVQELSKYSCSKEDVSISIAENSFLFGHCKGCGKIIKNSFDLAAHSVLCEPSTNNKKMPEVSFHIGESPSTHPTVVDQDSIKTYENSNVTYPSIFKTESEQPISFSSSLDENESVDPLQNVNISDDLRNYHLPSDFIVNGSIENKHNTNVIQLTQNVDWKNNENTNENELIYDYIHSDMDIHDARTSKKGTKMVDRFKKIKNSFEAAAQLVMGALE